MDWIRFSALSYLDEWLLIDQTSRSVIRFSDGKLVEDAEAQQQIAKVAARYGIARNFKKTETPRYGGLWRELKRLKPPANEEDAKELVAEFVEALKKDYDKELWSAASKILWMRFGHPIVIYDSLSWEWMCRRGDCPTGGSYADFYDAWRKSFEKRREDIREACQDLLSIRRFFRPNRVAEVELADAVRSEWFAERVLDHFMLNEPASVI